MNQEMQQLIEVLERLAWTDGAIPLDSISNLTSNCFRELLAQLPSDETLALLIQRDICFNEAFEELFVRRYATRLLRWFWHWCSNREDAADLMQQVLCRFLDNRLSSFDLSCSFRTYLYRAASNLHIDFVRRKARRKEVHLDAVPELATREPVEGSKALIEAYDAALLRLPADQRNVLAGTVAGRSTDEIAAQLNLSRSKVYTLLFKARREMERELDLPSQRRAYRKTEDPCVSSHGVMK